MVCSINYEEMMSLKLDGMLDGAEEASLEAHVLGCGECAPVWDALKEADALLWASMRVPAPVPDGFHARVMAQVASSPVRRPVAMPVEMPVPEALPVAVPRSVMPGLPIYALDEQPHPWQRTVSRYLRGAAAVALSLLGTLGLVMALVMSGTLSMGEPFSPMVDLVRTVLNSAGTWVRSLPTGMGPGALTVGALVAGSLLLIGWQVVAGYHRTVFERAGQVGYSEAAA